MLQTALVVKDSWQCPEREQEGELLREATEKEIVNLPNSPTQDGTYTTMPTFRKPLTISSKSHDEGKFNSAPTTPEEDNVQAVAIENQLISARKTAIRKDIDRVQGEDSSD